MISSPFVFKQMSSSDHSCGSGYSDLIKAFTDSKIEELLFGSALTSFHEIISGPSSPPKSPPALAPLSQAPSVSSDTESVPKAALAFYAFIERNFHPQPFVLDPAAYFLNNHPPIITKRKRNHCLPKKTMPVSYHLHPQNSKGRAITLYRAQ
ncbi:hypothetical protein O181_115264 [Austropuccinia psidii MF-1]|uniref:Uncharacterized protein n=1 Tax=Austropuccinia psidii MF-1 TaxID=1389203 RepID=A0A9Q3K6T2_9BASI|nr:hypothetical protein [Austropuccinia psidii MF-1]